MVNFNHAPCSFESICLLFTFWLKRSVSFKTIIPCMWKHQSVRNVINVRSRTTTRMDHINLGMPPTPVSHKALLSSWKQKGCKEVCTPTLCGKAGHVWLNVLDVQQFYIMVVPVAYKVAIAYAGCARNPGQETYRPWCILLLLLMCSCYWIWQKTWPTQIEFLLYPTFCAHTGGFFSMPALCSAFPRLIAQIQFPRL